MALRLDNAVFLTLRVEDRQDFEDSSELLSIETIDFLVEMEDAVLDWFQQ